jgi:hypothetical protein
MNASSQVSWGEGKSFLMEFAIVCFADGGKSSTVELRFDERQKAAALREPERGGVKPFESIKLSSERKAPSYYDR